MLEREPLGKQTVIMSGMMGDGCFMVESALDRSVGLGGMGCGVEKGCESCG